MKATVNGTGDVIQDVTWSVVSGPAGGAVNASGLFTSQNAGTFQVQARSTVANVNSNVVTITVNAPPPQTFTVTFRWGENLASSQQFTVTKGQAATAPSIPTTFTVTTPGVDPGDPPIVVTYTFTNWDADFSNVQGNMTVNALYSSS